jgi:RNA polymerase sigma factor (sigma-70 family)
MSGVPTDAIVVVRLWYVANAVDIHAYASRRVGRDLADDVVADTFRHAIESFDAFDPERGHERAWLFGIATNLLRRHWRTAQRRRAALERTVIAEQTDRPSADVATATAGRLDATADAAGVLSAVGQLSPDDYDLLVLTAWEQMSSAEAAAVLGIPAGTVRSRLHRIRKELDTVRRGPAPDTNEQKGDRA